MKDYEIAYLILVATYPSLSGLKDGVTFATKSRPYHRLGYVIRVTVVLVGLLYNHSLIFWLPFYYAYFWILFDLSWNFSANMNLLYVGKTADFDKFFAAKIYAAKASVLLVGIFVLLFKYKVI